MAKVYHIASLTILLSGPSPGPDGGRLLSRAPMKSLVLALLLILSAPLSNDAPAPPLVAAPSAPPPGGAPAPLPPPGGRFRRPFPPPAEDRGASGEPEQGHRLPPLCRGGPGARLRRIRRRVPGRRTA